MQNRSLSRRRLLGGGLLAGGAAFFLEACGDSPLGPGKASAKPAAPLQPSFGGLPRRLQVKQAIHVFSPRPLTPLQALLISKTPYEAVAMEGGQFVTSINRTPDLWVFVVDGAMPDLSGVSMVIRLGKVAINSPDEARLQLPRFRSGTIGLSLVANTDKSVMPPTVETEFAPAFGQSQVLISWLQVGLMQPDIV